MTDYPLPNESSEAGRSQDRSHSDWLSGGGEMGRLIRSKDWSNTPLGPRDRWPQALKTVLRVVLGSRYRMFLWWGRDLTKFYNDAYISILGKRLPGRSGSRPAQYGVKCGTPWDRRRKPCSMKTARHVMRTGCSSWNATGTRKKRFLPFPTVRCRTMKAVWAVCSVPARRAPSGGSASAVWPPFVNWKRMPFPCAIRTDDRSAGADARHH